MARVLYLVQSYPQISETYIQAELDRVKRRFEIHISTLHDPDLVYDRHDPFTKLTTGTREELAELAQSMRAYRVEAAAEQSFCLATR